MLKCTNTLSLPSSLILNRVRLCLPAVLIVRRVAYTCNLEIPRVGFRKAETPHYLYMQDSFSAHVSMLYRKKILPSMAIIFLFSAWL